MSLSDKIMNGWDIDVDLLDPDEVRKSIQELKDKFCSCCKSPLCNCNKETCDYCLTINKIFGPKLTQTTKEKK